MNTDFANSWAQAATSDTDALLDLYAEKFVAEHRAIHDHMTDTILEREDLRKAYAPFANTDPDNGLGIHRLKVKEYVGNERSGAILWDWSAEHLKTFFGVPVPSGAIGCFGQVHQIYDAEGKIVQESLYWNPVFAFQDLGLPVLTPHYWAADFDPASLAG